MSASERRAPYDLAFQMEREREYPQVFAFEQALGYAVDIERLAGRARISLAR